MTERTIAVIQAELRDIERHLVEMPPHSAGGQRAELQERAQRLRRELARARRRRGEAPR